MARYAFERLPLGEVDPLARLAAIRRETQALKDSRQAEAIELVNALHEWLPIDVQGFARGTINTVVTNVPGPAFPLYLCGAELLAIYPQAPLLEGIGLVTGVISYNGRLCWGFNADSDRVPDLDAFVAGVNRSYLELAEALGVRASGPIALVREAESPEVTDETAVEDARRRSAPRAPRRELPAATH
jgi:hypothetical protein